jgi:sugar lactone lactonase YvrE
MPNDDAIQTLRISGFSKPESVVHDSTQDVYFVSNVGPKGPATLDGDGFISRVSPDGTITELKAITGLNGPKGLCLFEDRLYVADINTLRIFNRVTGEPIASFNIADQLKDNFAKLFLNDVVVKKDGTAVISDSSVNSALIEVTPEGKASVLLSGEELGQPNGLQLHGENITWVTMMSNKVLRTNPSKKIFPDMELPPVDVSALSNLKQGALQLDGYVRLDDGRVLVSSWVTGEVSLLNQSGKKRTVVVKVASSFDQGGTAGPADINVDLTRKRILIPLFNKGQLLIVPLPD